jgi:5'-AMP-activated protein kinase catalytic alpha subunit
MLQTACGSPCYAAPEMIKGLKYSGLKADVWSSGVILFAMLAGYLPFEDANTGKLYRKITKCQYTAPKFISKEGRDAIQFILNTDPTKRPGVEQILAHPWFRILQNPISLNLGIKIETAEIPVDKKVLGILETYSFNKDTVFE